MSDVKIKLASSFVLICCLALQVLFVKDALAKDYLVNNLEEYKDSLPKLKPGDHLVLADGVWRDVKLVFEGKGTEEQPIYLRAETSGQVQISGVSNLRIAGEHLVIKGLVFKDGYSPSRELISFRKNKKHYANHVRFTENVVDAFNKPNRQDEDSWIVLHGKNNRVDHNHIVGKTNKGPSLIVRLNAKQSEENHHLIDHNYFGHRPTLGGNGGETMRIGVSQTSRISSYTKIFRNYFEHCNGEVEIISNKSERNTITENVFYESKGSVVFRHGGHNTVSRNIFFGNGVDDTGGVRVINNDQKVFDNYFEGLRGQKFNAGLTIMNGVPNSPENRYHQVDGGVIRNNSFYDIAHIGLGVGSDQERSAPPINTRFANNIVTSKNPQLVGVFDDISGIAFEDNVADNKNASTLKAKVVKNLKLKRAENGLLYPTKKLNAGAPKDLKPLKRHESGMSWYPKPKRSESVRSATVVNGNAGALIRALELASAGDILELSAGTYDLHSPLKVSDELTIKAAAGDKPVIRAINGPAIELFAGAELHLNGVRFEQANPMLPVIFAAGYKYDGKYSLTLENIEASSIAKESNGPFLSSSVTSFADAIRVKGLNVENWKGAVFDLSGQGLNGWYLADRLHISDSTFSQVSGPIVDFGRDGRDESTFGPLFKLVDSKIEQVKNVVKLSGIDGFEFADNKVIDSGQIDVQQRVLGYPFVMSGNVFENTPKARVTGRDGDTFNFVKE